MATWIRPVLPLVLVVGLTYSQSLEELARRKMHVTDSLNQLYQMGLWPPTPPPGTPLPLRLPESDCQNAIPVCQQTYTYSASPPDYGNIQELGNNTCLLNREQKTAWFIFTVQNSGTFGFIINTTYDYDFALFDYNAIGGCGGTATATPIRCNYSAQYGNTGLDANNPQPGSMQWNASQPPIMPGLNVTAGQTYILVVDNWTRDATGFTITFTGTAQIFDNIPPGIVSVQPSCTNPNQLIVTFNEPVKCSSLHPTDFNLGAGITVTSVSGIGCGTFTTQVVLTFTGTLTSGVKTLTIQTGSDGNTVQDKCNNAIPPGTTFNFQYLAPVSISGTSPICAGSSTTLTANTAGGIPAGATISWNTGANTASINVSPSSTTTYTVNITYGGCTRSATYTVTVSPNPTITVSPNPAIICSGTALVTGSTDVPGGQWQYNSGSGWINTPNPMNLGPGTYQIRYQSPAGCFSNIVNLQVATAPPANTNTCNVIYVTPTGSSTAAGTQADPTNLLEALSRAACSNTIIKMAVGTYVFNNPITTVTSNITIEGGFDPATGWRKTSQPGATTIRRTTANVEGCNDGTNAPRLVAFQIANASNFRLQDLTITVDNAPGPSATCASGRGISTYALHLSNCSNYNIVRCRFLPGQGGPGLAGANGSGFRSDGSPGLGGAGGAGSMTRCGGCGSAGSAGGAASTGAAGGAGGAGCCGSGCNIFGCDASGCTGCTGANGQNGADGANGTTPAIPTPTGPFFSPVQASAGQPGGHGGGGGGGGGGDIGTCCVSTCHSGGTCGARGGDGGRGGNPGEGGWGGGGSFAVYLHANNGGQLVDCDFGSPAGGSGGSGGIGANGEAGGAPGNRCVHGCAGTPCQRGCCGGDCGAGGLGGWGGSGGRGGNGGAGHAGLASRLFIVAGSTSLPTVTIGGVNQPIGIGSNNPANFNFSAQPIITVADISCTGTAVNFATSDAAPHNWNFGAGATPATSTNSPENVQYSTTGRKTITYDGYVYTDFWNILISNAAPTITASATSICVGGSLTFTTNLTGINYQWQIATDAAFNTVVGTGSTQTFTYTFTSAGTYYIRHRRYTDCCGWGAWSNVITVTVHPLPAAPTASGLSPVCRGAALVYTATAPAGVTFEWYTAATGGTLAGTGSTLTIPFTSGAASWPTNYNNTGTYTLYVEAVSPQGCRSSRTPVTITVDPPTAPTASPVSRCGPGPVVLVANYAGSGTPTYNWWDGPGAGATLLQTGGSNTFTTTVTTSTTFYVSVQVPGCVESARVPVTVTVNAAPATDTWTGAASSDWFNPNNWASGCLPNCGTTVTVPFPVASGRYPEIGWNPIPAACNSITIAAGASLTFTDVSAQLDVCGDFIHSGALNTTSGGRVRFIGSGVQNYTRAAGATGNFYQVIIDKPAAPLANRRVQVTQGNMTITNQLHLVDGRIATLATNAVVITNANPASIIGYNVNNYIQGRLQRAIQNTGGLYALPVGDIHPAQLATGKGYQLAEITLSNPTNVTALLSFFTPTPQTIPATAEPVCGTNYNCAIDNGFWTINLAGGNATGTTYNLTLYPLGYGPTCTTSPYFSIMKREGGPWYLNGTCCATSSLTTGVCRNGFNNGFSDFVVVGSTTPLPIAALTLQAKPEAPNIHLTWKADAEDNVHTYRLLRGETVGSLQSLTEVTADRSRTYEYTDATVKPGTLYYYQVVALSASGQEVLRSNAVQAILPTEGFAFAATLQPNPTRNDITLYLQLPESDALEAEVVNALGQTIWRWKGDLQAGLNAVPIPAHTWAKGVYLVRLVGARYEWSGRFVRE
jgi:hypothetical protein